MADVNPFYPHIYVSVEYAVPISLCARDSMLSM